MLDREVFFEIVKFILIVSFAFACMLAMVGWRRRERPGLMAFSSLAMAVALWCVCFAFELMSTRAGSAILWVKMQHVGIQAVPALWLMFAARYTTQDAWIGRPFYFAVGAVWTLSMGLFWTNELHGLVWPRVVVDTSLIPGVFVFERGPAFWGTVIYNYALLSAGTIIVVRSILNNRLLSGLNTAPLLIAQMMPWVGNLVFLSSPGILFGVDPTPLFFTASLGLLGWRLFRYQMLDLVRVERTLVIEEMSDGIMVVDEYNRILDLNKAARRIFNSDGEVIGRPASELIRGGRNLFSRFDAARSGQFEVLDGVSGEKKWYEAVVSPLSQEKRHGSGRIFHFRDITIQKKAETAEREQRLQAEIFRDTMAALNSTLRIDEVLERILTNVGRIVPHDASNIILLQPGGLGRVELCRGYENFGSGKPMKDQRFDPAELPNMAFMLGSGQPIFIPDVVNDARWRVLPGREWVRSYAAAPIKIHDQVIGFLSLDSSRPGFFTSQHIERLRAFADQAAIAVEKARLFARTEELAVTDALTGLSNRRSFMESACRELERARRHNQELAFLMIDIDNFKLVNDTFGHLLGDEVLKEVGRLLKQGLRSIDVLCRFGGEEFAALLPDTSMAHALATAERLRRMVEEGAGLVLPEKSTITISLGVAGVGLIEAAVLEDLIDNADKALYTAKREGRNRVRTF